MPAKPPTTEPHLERPGPAEFRDPLVRREMAKAAVWFGMALAIVGIIAQIERSPQRWKQIGHIAGGPPLDLVVMCQGSGEALESPVATQHFVALTRELGARPANGQLDLADLVTGVGH